MTVRLRHVPERFPAGYIRFVRFLLLQPFQMPRVGDSLGVRAVMPGRARRRIRVLGMVIPVMPGRVR